MEVAGIKPATKFPEWTRLLLSHNAMLASFSPDFLPPSFTHSDSRLVEAGPSKLFSNPPLIRLFLKQLLEQTAGALQAVFKLILLRFLKTAC